VAGGAGLPGRVASSDRGRQAGRQAGRRVRGAVLWCCAGRQWSLVTLGRMGGSLHATGARAQGSKLGGGCEVQGRWVAAALVTLGCMGGFTQQGGAHRVAGWATRALGRWWQVGRCGWSVTGSPCMDGAPVAPAKGLPARICAMGRWSSEIYGIYCRASDKAGIRLASQSRAPSMRQPGD
jgi:hypothetical protein